MSTETSWELPVDLKKSRRKKMVVEGFKIDRLPPHDESAEQGVLGCLLLSPQECIGEAIEKLKQGPEDFYDLRHRTLYQTLVEMWEEKEPVDTITVHARLKDRGTLESVGGLAYIAGLPDSVPSAANLTYYLEIMSEKANRRRIIAVCQSGVSKCYDESQDNIGETMDEIEKEIHAVCDEGSSVGLHKIKALVATAIDKIEQYHQNKGVILGISTGLADFDKMTNGLHGGEMVVIAGRPGAGKTAWSLGVAEHIACDLKIPVGVFSLEMSAESLILRMVCSRSRVNLRSIKDGFLVETDFPKMNAAAAKISSSPLHIDDSSGLSILQLRAKARRMQHQFGIRVFVVDYLQLLHSTNRRAENRQQEIADISAGLKSLSKELNVTVIALAQMNREIEKDKKRRPRLSDLRESGAIEADADLVGLLYDPNAGEGDEEAQCADAATQINLLIAKQRNGPVGDVKLTFLRHLTRFETMSKIEQKDIPVGESKRTWNE